MILYRVFPYDKGAAPSDRGGALFVPPSSGLGRIDNQGDYDVFYASANPAGAVAETFGLLPVWRSVTFVHGGGYPYALASYDSPDDLKIFELDDVRALESLGIRRPSDIVTRDRTTTQAWARKIFAKGTYAGARWWSYYDPGWPVIGLWQTGMLRVVGDPEILTASSRPVRDAAAAIVRQIVN